MSTIATESVRPPIATTAIAPEELLEMEDKGLFELVDGQLVERQMSYAATKTVGNIVGALVMYAMAKKIGDVLPEQSFQCFPHEPNQVRRPDVAFILAARVPAVLPTGHLKMIPDLAVEVVSPSDFVYDLDEKLADYRLAGIPLTWVVNPQARVVRVHRLGKPIEELYDGDILHGDPVLKDFSVTVTQLFPPKTASAEAIAVNQSVNPPT